MGITDSFARAPGALRLPATSRALAAARRMGGKSLYIAPEFTTNSPTQHEKLEAAPL